MTSIGVPADQQPDDVGAFSSSILKLSKAMPPASLEFTDFIAAARGPGDVQFHGSRFCVESVILYSDGIRLAWRMKPMPDLSWLPSDEGEVRRLASDEHGEHPGLVTVGTVDQQLTALWVMSALRDAAGTQFQLHQRRWTASQESGLEGELYALGAAPPIRSGSLVLNIADVAYPIPLLNTPRWSEGLEGFLGGDPGPEAARAFHDGAVKIISVLAYSDRVIIEWLFRPEPDVSWVPLTDEQVARIEDKSTSGRFLARYYRINNLWRAARMTDKLGTYYLPIHTHSHKLVEGHRGETVFRPGLVAGAGELHLTMDALSVFMPVTA
jgi:hypothetical protein